MKILFAMLISLLTACGGASEPQAVNPFQQAIGKQLPTQGLTVEPKDPFAVKLQQK